MPVHPDATADDETAATPARSFAELWGLLSTVDGWLTRAQAGRLWDRASELRAGQHVVEIGSYRGRSTVVLATAAPDGVTVTAIDPHGGNDRGPQEIEGFEQEAAADHRHFLENLRRAGVAARVRHLRHDSQDALAMVEGPVALLYIDGAHRFRPARADVLRWGARVAPGGRMLVHDSFSSVGVTLALLSARPGRRGFRYRGRTGSLAEYERGTFGRRTLLVSTLRQLAELPWFARNLAIKGLIVVGLGRATRLLGGDGRWPY